MTRMMPFAAARGMNRIEAARYVGLSPGTFDLLVKEGVMPKPRRVRSRLIFDRIELDAAFDALGEGAIAANSNDFDAAAR